MISIALGLFSAPADIASARETLAAAETESQHAAKAAEESRARRDAEESTLLRLKKDLADGGGWFTERAVRRQSAAVRVLVEETIAAGERVRAAGEVRDGARRHLRSVLFTNASLLTAAGDAAARSGRTDEAASRYREAAAALAEAAAVGPAGNARDPWEGLDAQLPITGSESPSELDAIARAYRQVVERVDRVLETLAPQLAAAGDAAAAWERLSRFRSILERAGGAAVDPRPGLEALRVTVARGEQLRAKAVANAERVEALRARVDVGPHREAP